MHQSREPRRKRHEPIPQGRRRTPNRSNKHRGGPSASACELFCTSPLKLNTASRRAPSAEQGRTRAKHSRSGKSCLMLPTHPPSRPAPSGSSTTVVNNSLHFGRLVQGEASRDYVMSSVLCATKEGAQSLTRTLLTHSPPLHRNRHGHKLYLGCEIHGVVALDIQHRQPERKNRLVCDEGGRIQQPGRCARGGGAARAT